MEHRQRIIPSTLLIPHSLAAADGCTNSSAPSTDLYLPSDFSIPPPPMPNLGANATPLFPQNHLLKFLATVGAAEDSSTDLINPIIQPWNQLGGGLSELHHLPGLPSSDLPLVLSGESSNERFSMSPFQPPLMPPPFPSSNQKREAVMKSKLERRRRSTMGDRIHILEGMIPCGRKMNTVTLLAEVHEYVKFLEAQVTALQSMPSGPSDFSTWPFYPSDLASAVAIGGLGRLNRQQLLQVMLNSPVVLDLLCKRGCCVMSAEQAAVLRPAMAPGEEGVLCDVSRAGGGAPAVDGGAPGADAPARA